MPRGRVPFGCVFRGPVPQHLRDRQEPSPASGDHLPAAGFQTARAWLSCTVGGSPYILHCKQHHVGRPLCKYLLSCSFLASYIVREFLAR